MNWRRINNKSLEERVYGFVKAHPNCYPRDVQAAFKLTRSSTCHALKRLHLKGCVVRSGNSQSTRYTVTNVKPTDDRGLAAGTIVALSSRWRRRVKAKHQPRRVRSDCTLAEVWR